MRKIASKAYKKAQTRRPHDSIAERMKGYEFASLEFDLDFDLKNNKVMCNGKPFFVDSLAEMFGKSSRKGDPDKELVDLYLNSLRDLGVTENMLDEVKATLAVDSYVQRDGNFINDVGSMKISVNSVNKFIPVSRNITKEISYDLLLEAHGWERENEQSESLQARYDRRNDPGQQPGEYEDNRDMDERYQGYGQY